MTTTTHDSAHVAGIRRRIMLARAHRGGDNIIIGRTSVATLERGRRRDSLTKKTPIVPLYLHVVLYLSNLYDVRYTEMLQGWPGWEHGDPPPRAGRKNQLDEKQITQKIAACLKEARVDAGESQATCAKVLDVMQSTYSRYEDPDTRWTPKIEDMQKLLDLHKLTWDDFLHRFTHVRTF